MPQSTKYPSPENGMLGAMRQAGQVGRVTTTRGGAARMLDQGRGMHYDTTANKGNKLCPTGRGGEKTGRWARLARGSNDRTSCKANGEDVTPHEGYVEGWRSEFWVAVGMGYGVSRPVASSSSKGVPGRDRSTMVAVGCTVLVVDWTTSTGSPSPSCPAQVIG